MAARSAKVATSPKETVPTRPFLRAQALDHVNIKVRDMTVSLEFYRDFLGLHVARVDNDENGHPDFVGLSAGSQTVFLSRNRDYVPPKVISDRGLNHLCIDIEPVDVNELLAEAKRRGLAVRERAARRRGERGASISTYVEDPDGHGVEIKQYPG